VTVLEQETPEKEENSRPFAAPFFEKALRMLFLRLVIAVCWW
jgi:hypothetical protein